MKNSREVRAARFIRQFFPFIEHCVYHRDFYAAARKYNATYKRKVIVKNGMSRVVFLTSDYVIKFDFERPDLYGGCEDELRVYQQAEQDGFAYLFAPITPIEACGYTWYVMPRVGGVERTENDVYDYLTDEENDWIAAHVQDLHSGNYGWYKGRPIIFDYACEVGM